MPSVEPLLLPEPGSGTGAALPNDRARTSSPLEFHRRLPGYAPSRVVDAPELADELGVAALTVKDESQRLGMPSFKILGASWAVYRLLVARLGHEPEWRDLDELRAAFAPARSAHAGGRDRRQPRARGRAHGAASRLRIADLRAGRDTARARIDGHRGEGAAVTVVDGTYDDAVRASAVLATDTVLVVSDTSWEGYTEVPRTVIEGYGTIFAELDEQLARAPPDVVVVPMGVGALAAAVVDHYATTRADHRGRAADRRVRVCGRPRPAGRSFVPGPHHSIMAGLNCGTVSVVAWPAVSRGVDIFVAVGDDDAEQRDARPRRDRHGRRRDGRRRRWPGSARSPRARPDPVRGRRVLVLCTEGATDPVAYERIVGRHRCEARRMRLRRCSGQCRHSRHGNDQAAISPQGSTWPGRSASPTPAASTTRPCSYPAVRAAGLAPLDPWAIGPELQAVFDLAVGSAERRARLPEVNRAVGARNAQLIDECDAVLAVLDGNDVDSGTAAEIGYAAAKHKPVVGLRLRSPGDRRQRSDAREPSGGMVRGRERRPARDRPARARISAPRAIGASVGWSR